MPVTLVWLGRGRHRRSTPVAQRQLWPRRSLNHDQRKPGGRPTRFLGCAGDVDQSGAGMCVNSSCQPNVRNAHRAGPRRHRDRTGRGSRSSPVWIVLPMGGSRSTGTRFAGSTRAARSSSRNLDCCRGDLWRPTSRSGCPLDGASWILRVDGSIVACRHPLRKCWSLTWL
jgi:hypothetical protein